jgi:hypothetical protein
VRDRRAADVFEEASPAGELLAELDRQGLESAGVAGHIFRRGDDGRVSQHGGELPFRLLVHAGVKQLAGGVMSNG